MLGRIICGDQYLKPVKGVMDDNACGFNMDMYLLAFLLIVLVSGLVLFFTSVNQKTVHYFINSEKE
jgi:hypothetical protein